MIRVHLVPYFGSKDLRTLEERDLLAFIEAKLAEGLALNTVRNMLAVLRRVLYLAQREGRVERNPAARIGELTRRVGRRLSSETAEAEAWTRDEVVRLLTLADQHEPAFAPMLRFLFATGARRGEALGLRWEDVNFSERSIRIRRSVTHGEVTTPKSGRGRVVGVPPGLLADLEALLATRRREAIAHGWREVPGWVFCSTQGTPLEANAGRTWERLRRRAQAAGIRALKLHSTRHTWATHALSAGKSIRWVAHQLGHADPALTLRVYAHMLREEETDLGFADFSAPIAVDSTAADAPERPQTAPALPIAVASPSAMGLRRTSWVLMTELEVNTPSTTCV